jgi:hypothetical protein
MKVGNFENDFGIYGFDKTADFANSCKFWHTFVNLCQFLQKVLKPGANFQEF